LIDSLAEHTVFLDHLKLGYNEGLAAVYHQDVRPASVREGLMIYELQPRLKEVGGPPD
jgi:hypothetical protein